jgi:hypothetical protein
MPALILLISSIFERLCRMPSSTLGGERTFPSMPPRCYMGSLLVKTVGDVSSDIHGGFSMGAWEGL